MSLTALLSSSPSVPPPVSATAAAAPPNVSAVLKGDPNATYQGEQAVADQKADITAQGVPILEKARKDTDSAYADNMAEIRKLQDQITKPPPSLDQAHPWQVLGSSAMFLTTVMAGGGKYHTVNMMNAATGVIRGFQEGNAEKYKRSMDQWKQELQNVQTAYQMQTKLYDDSIAKIDTDEKLGLAELQVKAASLKDPTTVALAAAGDAAGVKEHLLNIQGKMQQLYKSGLDISVLDKNMRAHAANYQASSDVVQAGQLLQAAKASKNPMYIAKAQEKYDAARDNYKSTSAAAAETQQQADLVNNGAITTDLMTQMQNQFVQDNGRQPTVDELAQMAIASGKNPAWQVNYDALKSEHPDWTPEQLAQAAQGLSGKPTAKDPNGMTADQSAAATDLKARYTRMVGQPPSPEVSLALDNAVRNKGVNFGDFDKLENKKAVIDQAVNSVQGMLGILRKASLAANAAGVPLQYGENVLNLLGYAKSDRKLYDDYRAMAETTIQQILSQRVGTRGLSADYKQAEDILGENHFNESNVNVTNGLTALMRSLKSDQGLVRDQISQAFSPGSAALTALTGGTSADGSAASPSTPAAGNETWRQQVDQDQSAQ